MEKLRLRSNQKINNTELTYQREKYQQLDWKLVANRKRKNKLHTQQMLLLLRMIGILK